MGINGVGASPSSSSSSEVSESLSDASSEASDSSSVSDAVDGAYSCLSGDEDLRLPFLADVGEGGGCNIGTFAGLSGAGLVDR